MPERAARIGEESGSADADNPKDAVSEDAKKSYKTHWHQAFVAALEMELEKDRGGLSFEAEHSLNRMPLLIDCLVIKKRKDLVIENEIGRHFRDYNIIEYKSPNDGLTIDDLAKAQGYAHLFKSYGTRVNEIKFDEVTVTMVRDSRPNGLFRYLEENGCKVTNPCAGIYYIESGFKFPTQIIVGRELEGESHRWLHLLTDRVTEPELARAVSSFKCARFQERRNLIGSILAVAAAENKESVRKLKEVEGDMWEALLEIAEPEIEERVERETTERLARETERVEREATERIAREKDSAIRTMVAALRGANFGDDKIKETLEKSYGFSDRDALSYL